MLVKLQMVATGKVTRRDKRLSFTPENVEQTFEIAENDKAGKLAKALKGDETWVKLTAEMVDDKKPSSTKDGANLQITVVDFSFQQEKPRDQ